MKIFIAIPVYDGKLQVQTVACLLQEQLLASMSGDELMFSFLPSCSVPAMGRNQLVQDFLDSECERMFFLDADITFELGSLLKLARSPADFVGGCYRYKLDEEIYPIGWLEGKELWSNELGHLEVATIPTGFLALSRKVFEDFKAFHPGREFEHFGKKMFCYFEMVFADGQLHSDDTYFCKKYREAGGKVFLDPELTLTHWDFNKPFVGQIGNWLKSRKG